MIGLGLGSLGLCGCMVGILVEVESLVVTAGARRLRSGLWRSPYDMRGLLFPAVLSLDALVSFVVCLYTGMIRT